jgi:hypothetical protein
MIYLKVFALSQLEECTIFLLPAFLHCSKFQYILLLSEKWRLGLHILTSIILYIKNKLRGFSPPAKYTDLVTAACRRS